MGKANLEIAEAGFNWRFEKTLPSLPFPGNESFTPLFDALHPFLRDAQSIGVTPMRGNLAEFGLEARLILPGSRAETRLFIGYDEFGVLASNANQGDFADVLDLIQKTYCSLAGFYGEVVRHGAGIFRIGLHSKLQDESLNRYLEARIHLKIGEEQVWPDAVVADIPIQMATPGPTKLTLARSLFISSGLYVEISSGCNGAFLEDSAETNAANALAAYQRILNVLKLEV